MSDFDICIYCGATGCETGTAEHGEDCPMETGLYPITERDLTPRCRSCGASALGGPGCCRCGVELAPGDHYVHQGVAGDVYEVLCVGCGALERPVSA